MQTVVGLMSAQKEHVVNKSVDQARVEKLIGGSRAGARSVSDQEVARQGPDYIGGKAYDRPPVIAEAQLPLLGRRRSGGTCRET